MSVQAIYSCKLYKASKRKDKIRAAVSNPMNSELVVQLDEYLDQDQVDELNIKPSKEHHESDEADKSSEDKSENEKIRPSTHSSNAGGGHVSHTSGSEGPDHHLSEAVAEAEARDDKAMEQAASAESKSSDEDVAESTHLTGTNVNASHCPCACVLPHEVESIVGLLNAQADTAGVRRGVIKDENEVWLYYNDNTNLNNVMEPVIALLNASNYSHLDFNRLARTDNAMVFIASKSAKPIESMEEIQNDQ